MSSGGVKRSAAPPVPGGVGSGAGGMVGPGPTKKGLASAEGTRGEGARGIGNGTTTTTTSGGPPVPLIYSSAGQQQQTQPSDDVTMHEAPVVPDKVTLQVVLPSGAPASSPVTVDFNMPMRDLLIHLAATFKVAPTAHVLQILDPDTGKGLEFKPAQTIGALTASTVYIVPKNKKAEWGKAMMASTKATKGFEITNRFTINLPGGQKAVMRVSPQLTLEQVFARVCRDKSLDSRRFVLQHPDNPLAPLDLKASIADCRLTGINLIHSGAASSVGDSSRSMPDLHRGMAAASSASQDPASWHMPGTGETKKKRGFLSFLSKKDKKFKPHETRYITTTETPGASQPPPPQHPASKTTTLPAPRKASTPPVQRRRLDTSGSAPASTRPKSVFVTGSGGIAHCADVTSTEIAGKASAVAPSKGAPTAAAAAAHPGRKRPAPPPPPMKKASAAAVAVRTEAAVPDPTAGLSARAPSSSSRAAVAGSKDSGLSAGLVMHPVIPEGKATTATTTAAAAVAADGVKPAAAGQAPVCVRPAEAAPPGLSRLHSRNSSDSSGYHELTLSGAESPVASHVRVSSALKTSLDTTSIESADHPNGDSGVQDLSPASEGSIATAAPEKPLSTAGGAMAAGRGASSSALSPSQQQNSHTIGSGKPDLKPKPLPSTKKKKAPPPPPKAKPAPVRKDSPGVVSSQSEPPLPPPSTSVSGTKPRTSLPPPQHFKEDITVSTVYKHAAGKTSPPGEGDDEEQSDTDSGEAFNLDDILDAVEFEEPPLRTTINTTTTATTTEYSEEEEPEQLAMVETASVLSEDVQVPDDRVRPCEFIPPPPPEEPPPPEDDYPLPTQYPPPLEYGGQEETHYWDRGSVVGEDNASLAPSSLKGSPVSTYHRRSDSRGSLASLDSIDTVEGLSLAFAQTIALGEETLESEQWREEEQGYPNEMARFVAQMARLTTPGDSGGGDDDDKPAAESGDLSSNNTSLSLQDTESVSDTGSVIYHGEAAAHARGDSKDSTVSVSSADRPAASAVLAEDRGSGGGGGGPTLMQEMDAPLETVPPPLGFQGDEEEDEEEVTVVTEEYIFPVGPAGPDYSAAVRVSEAIETVSGHARADISGRVFRAEPVSILPPKQRFVEEKGSDKSVAKEEFVLTLEDLTSVSMVPPRPKISAAPAPAPKPALMEPDPQLEPEPQPVAETLKSDPPSLARVPLANVTRILGHHSERMEGRPTDFKKPPQHYGVRQGSTTTAEKPLSTLYLPTMRYSHGVEPMTFSDDDRSSESSSDHVLGSRVVPGGGRTADDASDASSDRPGGLDSRRMSNSSNASQTQSGQADVDLDPAREELQKQYGTLQDQFVLWQQQLQQNQALLAAHSDGSAGGAHSDDTLQTLQAQVQMQQQMMTQLQTSMQALAMQQQQHGVVEEDVPAPPVNILAPALPAEGAAFQSFLSPPSYPPPPPPIEEPELPSPTPPPPPPAPPASASTASQPKVIKAGTKPRASAASRFEPQLDPREQLMLAIRSFGCREQLKAVPMQATKRDSNK